MPFHVCVLSARRVPQDPVGFSFGYSFSFVFGRKLEAMAFSTAFTSFRAGMPGISMPGGTALSFRSKSSFIIRA